MDEKKNKNDCTYKLSKLLRGLDGFGVGFSFNVKNNDTYRSTLGGIIFSVYSILSIIYIAVTFYWFAWRKNLSLISTNRIVRDVPPINLTALNFMYSISLIDAVTHNRVNNTIADYFEYEFNHYNIETEENRIKKSIPIKICEKSDFNTPDIEYSSEELNSSIKGYCPDVKGENGFKDMILEGFRQKKDVQYIKSTLSIKKEKIKDFHILKDSLMHHPIKMEITFTDHGVDFNNYFSPLPTFINDYPLYIDIGRYTKVFNKFANLQFSSDKNILFYNPESEKRVVYDSTKVDSYAIERDEKYERYRKVMSIYFFLSPKTMIIQREYQKITDFIANMTAVVSELVIIFVVFITQINEIGAKQAVLHRIVKFRGNKNFDRERMLKVFTFNEMSNNELSDANPNINPSNSQHNIPNHLEIQNSVNNRSNTLNLGCSINDSGKKKVSYVRANKSLHYLDETVRKKLGKSKNNNLVNENQSEHELSHPGIKKMNSYEICLSVCCCCIKKWNKKRKLIDKGDEKLNHYLDIVNYFKKMTELDYMKYIFLSSDQIPIFNFVSSPMVSQIKDQEFKEFWDEEMKKKVVINKDYIDKLYHSYQTVINSPKSSSSNFRLVKTFDFNIEALKSESVWWKQ